VTCWVTNKHQDISFLCLFATQNRQDNPLLNILSLVVCAERKIVRVRIDTQNRTYSTLNNTDFPVSENSVFFNSKKKRIIPIWNFLDLPKNHWKIRYLFYIVPCVHICDLPTINGKIRYLFHIVPFVRRR
jgi:hypothetical protein